ncbi:SigE family RNA polymerase sigma factor [Kribbella deserti]|uniref:SigE family RNA polymerase sigma factor n=1 Tax=Kribbella deserti TaxID=1926257 RepID=A0ABV6QRB5_9ACTN
MTSDRDREFAEFVAVSSVALQRTAFLVCADRDHAADAVQEALYRLYVSWPKFQRATNPMAYARRAVVNAAVDAGRRPWRRERVVDAMPETPSEDTAGQHAVRDELLSALRELPPRRRACVALRYYEDLTIEETAEILGCSIGTVKSQTARGLETLRKSLVARRAQELRPEQLTGGRS